MAGISSKAAGKLGNNKLYNGIEHTTDLDLNQYDAFYRTLDPQTGRFLQMDPKIESMEMWSPYTSNYDNPIRYQDPLGDEGEEANGPGPKQIVTLGKELYNIYRLFRAGENINNALDKITVSDVIRFFAPISMVDPPSRILETSTGGSSGAVKAVPNPNGKKGSEAHQKTIDKEEQRLKEEGFDKTEREVKVETPGGAKDKRYIDLKGTNTKNGETETVQVGKQNKNTTPVSRETKALNDIEKATGQRPVFTPYNYPVNPFNLY